MTFTIRYASLDDFAGLLALFAETNRFHAARVPQAIQEIEPIITPNWLDETLHTPDQWLLVAVEDAKPIGLLLMQLRATPDGDILVPRRYLYVHEIAVLEGYRRRGVGRALMAAAQAIAADQGVQQVELDVWQANAEAKAFYRSLGFETVLCRMRYIGAPGEDA